MLALCCLKNTIIELILSVCFLLLPLIISLTIFIPIWIMYWRHVFINKKNLYKRKNITVGIFHPYCNAGGGGERVLWKSIEAIQEKYHDTVNIVVYTGDIDIQPEKMLKKVKETFDIELNNVEFVYLLRRKWVEAYMYPRLTLIAQSIGSIYLGFEALQAFRPDIFIDTMGYAFTYPLFKYLAECHVISYTHYPTISTDMLQQVQQRIVSHNNQNIIAKNPILSFIKVIYYRSFASLYGYMGSCADIIMVNSTWTEGHINSIWKCPTKTIKVYPPCDIEHLVSLPLLPEDKKKNMIRIVSVAQFRPEKNHSLMIKVMNELKLIIENDVWKKIRLVLVGSCRNDDDKKRVNYMKDLAKELQVDENVEFKLNVSYNELIDEFQLGTVGLHAMWNEHFGISVVECMAAGLITIAHNSGGPKADIVKTQVDNRTGFLASEAVEYAKIISDIIRMSDEEKMVIRNAARNDVKRFSSHAFGKEFLTAIEPFFPL